MMGTEAFRAVFGAVPAGDEEQYVRLVLAGARAGFAVVLVRPGLKAPMCTLTTAQAKLADQTAQEEARAAGRQRVSTVRHPCGIAHALQLSGDPELKSKEEGAIGRTVRRALKRYDGRLNIGVELGRSRMIVVDVDTLVERDAFLTDWAAATGVDRAGESYTVASPGAQGPDGSWVHSEGGHWWFTLPEGYEIPTGEGVLKMPSGWSVMWRDRQVLVPPSARPEGVYRMTGAAQQAPGWLLDAIDAGVLAKTERREAATEKILSASDPIDIWSAQTDWGTEILTPAGWTETGLADTCSCPIWTAPGDHASPKSATAHELGCALFDSSTGWAPIHIWTDNPPGYLAGHGRTLTKLQFVAWKDHEGDQKKSMRALGIQGGTGIEPDDLFEMMRFDAPSPAAVLEDVSTIDTDPFASPDDDDLVLEGDSADTDPQPAIPDSPPAELSKVDRLIEYMRSSAELDDIADPEPLVAGMLDKDTLARVTGKSGHGKTFLMIDLACRVATGQPWLGRHVAPGMVVYMVAEGVRGYKKRVRAWEARYNGGEHIPADRLQVLDIPVQVRNASNWDVWTQAVERLGAVLVVMDTQARITVGVDENNATEMGEYIEQLEKVRRATKACVAVVHHLGHQGEQGRGSSAVLGAINTEIRVTKAGPVVTVINEKQKDEEGFASIELTLEHEGTSAVLVGEDVDQDPFAEAGPPGGADAPAGDRMLRLLHSVAPALGLTKAESKSIVLQHDRNAYGRPMTAKTFYNNWDVAGAAGDLIRIDGPGARWKVSASAIARLILE